MAWTPDRLSHLATAYWQSATLVAAVELGLFDVLEGDSCTAADVATRLGVSADQVEALLDALVSLELLEKHGPQYLICTDARPLLLRSSPTCMLDALAYNGDLYHHWAKLPDLVRFAKPAVEQKAQLGSDTARTQRFVRGMESKARAYTPVIAPMIDLDGEATLLDVGSGPGTLSRHLAERHPGLSVTLLDLPDVLAVAKSINAGSTVAGRLHYHPADYRRDALPGPFDAVVYAGALHQESCDSAGPLFAQFAQVLKPGGRLFVVDLLLDSSRTKPVFSTLFQLNMRLIQPASRVFSEAEVQRLMTDAGLTSIEVRRPYSPYRLVVARKPKVSS